jgi:hypothetical protein
MGGGRRHVKRRKEGRREGEEAARRALPAALHGLGLIPEGETQASEPGHREKRIRSTGRRSGTGTLGTVPSFHSFET